MKFATILLSTLILAMSMPIASATEEHAPTCTDYDLQDIADWMGAESTVAGGVATLGGIPDDACSFSIHLSSYILPNGYIHPFDEQELYNDTQADFPDVQNGDQLVVLLPPCNYQTDLYLGVLVEVAPHHTAHPGNPNGDTLVAWDAVQGNTCEAPCPTLTAHALDNGDIHLSVEGLSTDATLWRASQHIADLPAGTTSYLDTNTTVGTAYQYELRIDDEVCATAEATSIPTFGTFAGIGLLVASLLGYLGVRRR